MNVDHFRTLFEYNTWAHRRVWDCVMRLDEAQYRQPCDYSIGSVHEQLVHTFGAERLWLQRSKGIPATGLPKAEEVPDRAALRADWDALTDEWRAFVNGLTDADLERVMTYTSIAGNQTRHTPLWLMLMQILNHGTDHRAQTLALIHQLGGETIAQDLLFYTWE